MSGIKFKSKKKDSERHAYYTFVQTFKHIELNYTAMWLTPY